MIIAHFYKNTEKKYSVYANSLEEVKAEPLKYYRNFTEGMYITDMEFVYPRLEKGKLRESTREELAEQGIEILLEEGEKIVNKKLIIVEKPSQYHEWNGTEWIVDLTELKLQKNEELKRIRTEKINANISMFGGEFQVRNFEDIENFNDLERAIRSGKMKTTDKITWRLADNTFKEFLVGQLTKILDAKAERKSIIYDDFRKIAEQLWACKTVEEIEKIEWQ